MKDEGYFIGMTTVGVILTLWILWGLVCVGRERTYRLGLWVLGSGVVVGAFTALLWDWT